MTTFNPFGNTSSKSTDLLVSFTPAKFDILIKVLSLFDKSNDSICIKSSNIVQKFGSAIANADISSLFDDQVVDLEIVQPKKYIKLFKQFKNNTNIDVIEDSANNRYVITNGEIKLFLPKQATPTSDDTLMPDFEDCEMLHEMTIDKETSKQLIGLSSDSNYIEYLFQDNKLKGVHIPDTAIYLFNEFLEDPKAKNLDETNADEMLRTGVFLAIPAEDYKLTIGKLKNGNHFSITDCNTGMVHVNLIEQLDLSTGGSLLI